MELTDMASRNAVGLVPHTGWAWLVRVTSHSDAPIVEARSRVVACEVVAGELYHLAAEHEADRERFLATRRAAAARQAHEALTRLVVGAGSAIVVGKQMELPTLHRIVSSHPLIHGAEGELWRGIFAEACAAHGLSVVRASAADIRTALATAYKEPAIESFLHEGKRVVGAPWTREIQDAALAAWAGLSCLDALQN